MKTLNTKAFTLWARPHMVIRGFKHLNEGMQCQGFEFEINKEYIHEGDLKMCEQGFHFCEKLSQIPLYKNIFKGSTHIVEARNVIFGQDKIVCRSIKIISLPLSFQEWLFFANDGKNNCGFGNQGDGNQGDGNRGNWNQGNGIKEIGIKETGIKETGIKETRIKETGIEETEIKETGIKETGIKETGIKETGIKETGIKETGIKETGIKETGIKETGIRNEPQ